MAAERIKGYRALSAAEVATINKVKTLGDEIASLIAELTDPLLVDPKPDPRWVSIGKTHMQQGLMALERSGGQAGGVLRCPLPVACAR